MSDVYVSYAIKRRDEAPDFDGRILEDYTVPITREGLDWMRSEIACIHGTAAKIVILSVEVLSE